MSNYSETNHFKPHATALCLSKSHLDLIFFPHHTKDDRYSSGVFSWHTCMLHLWSWQGWHVSAQKRNIQAEITHAYSKT